MPAFILAVICVLIFAAVLYARVLPREDTGFGRRLMLVILAVVVVSSILTIVAIRQ